MKLIVAHKNIFVIKYYNTFISHHDCFVPVSIVMERETHECEYDTCFKTYVGFNVIPLAYDPPIYKSDDKSCMSSDWKLKDLQKNNINFRLKIMLSCKVRTGRIT